MANVLFAYGREGFATGDIQWDSDDIRVMLVKDTYTFDDTDQYLADLGAVDNGRSGALTTKTTTGGVCDADDITSGFTATSAVACNAIIAFKHTGSDATARLIFYETVATGLPFTPAAGAGIGVQWSSGSNKIFKL